jgi:hypothetical protein
LKELHKLRSSTTDEEREAFYWFAGEFVESVAGRKTWGKQKYSKLMSEGTRVGEKPLVSQSDEAFALLIIDNYQERWIIEKKDKEDNIKTSRMRKGKYTCAKSGNREYRGWSKAGILEYGRLLKLVQTDRRADPEKAAEMWVKHRLAKTKKPLAVGVREDDSGGEEADIEMFDEADFDE